MVSYRQTHLLLNSLFFFFIVSTIFNVPTGFVLTIVALAAVYFYHIPCIPNETVVSRLQQTTNEEADEKMNIILHRGGIFDLPENTLEAVKMAYECGAGAVEIDLEFTEDGVGICLHDNTLDRTTDGCGRICKMKYDHVQKLDAAAKHTCRSKTGPLKIPSLEECVCECLKLNLRIYIDCKSQPQKTAELLSNLYKKYPDLYKKGIVCSFYPQLIYAVRKKDPNILTGLTHRHKVLSTNTDGTSRNKELWKKIVTPVLDVLLQWLHNSLLWYLCGNSFFLLHKDTVSNTLVKSWRMLGVQIVPWTVNDPREKAYFLHSLQCPIVTDGMNSQ